MNPCRLSSILVAAVVVIAATALPDPASAQAQPGPGYVVRLLDGQNDYGEHFALARRAVPGNDDAARAIQTYCDLIADAVLDGLAAGAGASGVDLGASENPVEPMLHQALTKVSDTVASGGRVLFVATKRQASDGIAEAAKRSAQYFINHRWLGGTLTNWKTISQSIRRLRQLDDILADPQGRTKKEVMNIQRERDKLNQSLGGIKDMGGTPDLLFVIDTNKESIAIKEARKLGIPIVAIVGSRWAFTSRRPVWPSIPTTSIDAVARHRLSTVYMPGHKITMLPDDVVQRYTLEAGRDCPAVSLYVSFDEATLEIRDSRTALERVPIAHNLRHDQLDSVITEAWLTGEPPVDGANTEIAALQPQLAFLYRLTQHVKAQRELVRGKPETFTRPDYTFKLQGMAGDEPDGSETVVIGTRSRD